jgi:uncharacterized protein YdeI (YjbR/CyaY-like superfamily)
MIQKNRKVDVVLSKAKKWREEMEALRGIVLDCGLTEELKWYQPCYTFEKTNVAIIGGFKDCCVLSFFKGALLKDARGILSKPGENTQSARMIRFTSVREITEMEPVLKAYIQEAVEVEKAGLKVEFKKELVLPAELQSKLDGMPALKKSFTALTPGRQRAYVLYFSAPKQSKTREARVEKCVRRILEGKGMNDE